MEDTLKSRSVSEVSNDRLLYTKPGLIVVQRSFMAPGRDFPARWVIFDPESRRSFLIHLSYPAEASGGESNGCVQQNAMREHSISDTICALALASENGVLASQLLREGVVAEPETIDNMISLGLVQYEPVSPASLASFTGRYHRAVFNYPFHDYFDPQWRELDNEAMSQYMAAWPPPAPLTERIEKSFPLHSPSDDELVRGDRAGVLSLAFLGSVLHKVFGVIEERQRPVVGTVVRKTSPSGGCRHPSEVVLLLPKGLESIPPGAYHYDVRHHRLAQAAGYSECLKSVTGSCAFLLTSRVERAMWRYRDIRSFRAIPVDAGHIAETLVLLLGLRELECAISAVGSMTTPDFTWHEEPELALISVGPDNIARTKSAPQRHDNMEGPFLINPSLYLTFDSGHVKANIHWPRRASVNATAKELEFLDLCLPDQPVKPNDSDRFQSADFREVTSDHSWI
jgi:hypothetical protein